MTESVTRRSTFDALSTDGERHRHGPVQVRSIPADHPAMEPDTTVALAFAFSRRFGTAVDRNRAKRRLRAAFVDAGGDRCRGAVLMTGRRELLDRPYSTLVDDVRRCVAHLDTVTSNDATTNNATTNNATTNNATTNNAAHDNPGRGR